MRDGPAKPLCVDAGQGLPDLYVVMSRRTRRARNAPADAPLPGPWRPHCMCSPTTDLADARQAAEGWREEYPSSHYELRVFRVPGGSLTHVGDDITEGDAS